MQCHAHKRNGAQCGAQAMHGTTVCKMHGGLAPQVREAARLRLLSMVDPALGTLARAVQKRKGIPGPTEIAAAREILSRAGIGEQPAEQTTSAGVTVVLNVRGVEPAAPQRALPAAPQREAEE